MIHDFGVIEEGAIPSHNFVFSNQSQKPVQITRVRASCGCTTPKWPRNPIPADSSALISVEFNSTRRTGQFNKSISVSTPEATIVLRIKGFVQPKYDPYAEKNRIAHRKDSLQALYPIDMGGLWFSKEDVSIQELKKSRTRKFKIQFINASNETINFLRKKDIPRYLKIDIPQMRIDPGETAAIEFTIIYSKYEKYKKSGDVVVLHTDQEKDNRIRFKIDRDVTKEIFTSKKVAPLLSFGRDTIKLGSITKNQKIAYSFELQNLSGYDLEIGEMVSNNPMLETIYVPQKIASNQTAEIRIEFDAGSIPGKVNAILETKILNQENTIFRIPVSAYIVESLIEKGIMKKEPMFGF